VSMLLDDRRANPAADDSISLKRAAKKREDCGGVNAAEGQTRRA
jgi:hypothetical protein